MSKPDFLTYEKVDLTYTRQSVELESQLTTSP
jgi:hypothetical protein